MTRNLPLAAAVLAAGLLFTTMPGMATTGVSLGALKSVGATQSSAVEKTAWGSRCRWGFGGYHKWVPGVGRVRCTARKCWRNSWGIRRCRWF